MNHPNPQKHLASSEWMDCEHPLIKAEAGKLAGPTSSELELVRARFEFVRNEIRHIWDHQLNPVTCII